MLGLGLGEILVIAALLLVVVGPDRLPYVFRWAGKTYGQVRRASDELRRAFVIEADRMDADERFEALQQRRRMQEDARARALAAAGPGAVAQPPQLQSPSELGGAPAALPPAAPPQERPGE